MFKYTWDSGLAEVLMKGWKHITKRTWKFCPVLRLGQRVSWWNLCSSPWWGEWDGMGVLVARLVTMIISVENPSWRRGVRRSEYLCHELWNWKTPGQGNPSLAGELVKRHEKSFHLGLQWFWRQQRLVTRKPKARSLSDSASLAFLRERWAFSFFSFFYPFLMGSGHSHELSKRGRLKCIRSWLMHLDIFEKRQWEVVIIHYLHEIFQRKKQHLPKKRKDVWLQARQEGNKITF